ncbi:unnamed protein product [Amoebophrya sp. A120]|nr:unnamed protein product [Amoebophrya sp. A120]|eukprot:GSA120T00004414001.1
MRLLCRVRVVGARTDNDDTANHTASSPQLPSGCASKGSESEDIAIGNPLILAVPIRDATSTTVATLLSEVKKRAASCVDELPSAFAHDVDFLDSGAAPIWSGSGAGANREGIPSRTSSTSSSTAMPGCIDNQGRKNYYLTHEGARLFPDDILEDLFQSSPVELELHVRSATSPFPSPRGDHLEAGGLLAGPSKNLEEISEFELQVQDENGSSPTWYWHLHDHEHSRQMLLEASSLQDRPLSTTSRNSSIKRAAAATASSSSHLMSSDALAFVPGARSRCGSASDVVPIIEDQPVGTSTSSKSAAYDPTMQARAGSSSCAADRDAASVESKENFFRSGYHHDEQYNTSRFFQQEPTSVVERKYSGGMEDRHNDHTHMELYHEHDYKNEYGQHHQFAWSDYAYHQQNDEHYDQYYNTYNCTDVPEIGRNSTYSKPTPDHEDEDDCAGFSDAKAGTTQQVVHHDTRPPGVRITSSSDVHIAPPHSASGIGENAGNHRAGVPPGSAVGTLSAGVSSSSSSSASCPVASSGRVDVAGQQTVGAAPGLQSQSLRPYQLVGYSKSSLADTTAGAQTSCGVSGAAEAVRQNESSSCDEREVERARGPSNCSGRTHELPYEDAFTTACSPPDQYVEIVQEQKAIWTIYGMKDKLQSDFSGATGTHGGINNCDAREPKVVTTSQDQLKLVSPPFTLFGMKGLRLVLNPGCSRGPDGSATSPSLHVGGTLQGQTCGGSNANRSSASSSSSSRKHATDTSTWCHRSQQGHGLCRVALEVPALCDQEDLVHNFSSSTSSSDNSAITKGLIRSKTRGCHRPRLRVKLRVGKTEKVLHSLDALQETLESSMGVELQDEIQPTDCERAGTEQERFWTATGAGGGGNDVSATTDDLRGSLVETTEHVTSCVSSTTASGPSSTRSSNSTSFVREQECDTTGQSTFDSDLPASPPAIKPVVVMEDDPTAGGQRMYVVYANTKKPKRRRSVDKEQDVVERASSRSRSREKHRTGGTQHDSVASVHDLDVATKIGFEKDVLEASTTLASNSTCASLTAENKNHDGGNSGMSTPDDSTSVVDQPQPEPSAPPTARHAASKPRTRFVSSDLSFAARQAAKTIQRKIKRDCETAFADKVEISVEILDVIDEHEELKVSTVQSHEAAAASSGGGGGHQQYEYFPQLQATWSIWNVRHKLAKFGKNTPMFSDRFSLGGIDDLRFKLYLNGKPDAADGWCSLYLEAPKFSELKCRFHFRNSGKKLSFERLEKFHDKSNSWGFVSAAKVEDEMSSATSTSHQLSNLKRPGSRGTSSTNSSCASWLSKAFTEDSRNSRVTIAVEILETRKLDYRLSQTEDNFLKNLRNPDRRKHLLKELQRMTTSSCFLNTGSFFGDEDEVCEEMTDDEDVEDPHRLCSGSADHSTNNGTAASASSASNEGVADLHQKHSCRRKCRIGGRSSSSSSSNSSSVVPANKVQRVAELQENMKNIPNRFRILLLDGLPDSAKQVALQKWESLQVDANSGEAQKTKKWLDGLLALPFGKFTPPPVLFHPNGKAETRRYLQKTQSVLDSAVFGHDEAKEKILQLICQWIANPQSQCLNLGIQGPPGNGKTTLCRKGIAKALSRPFVQISLGGATDAALLEGHHFTYVGSTWGRLAGMLMETKCMDPIIFFDELDKVSDTPRGEEIVGVLTHLTDHSQNASFTDRYFDGVPLDFSNALFIFSFNDETKLNPVLRDRLTVINTKGFNPKEQLRIAQQFLLPDLLKNVGMNAGDVLLEDLDQLRFVTFRHGLAQDHGSKDGGVRGLKQALEAIVLKVNKLRLIQHCSSSRTCAGLQNGTGGGAGAASCCVSRDEAGGVATTTTQEDEDEDPEDGQQSSDNEIQDGDAVFTVESRSGRTQYETAGSSEEQGDHADTKTGTFISPATEAGHSASASSRRVSKKKKERKLTLPVKLTRKNVEWLLPQKQQSNESYRYMYT